MSKSTHWTACTAQGMDGSFCDERTIPGAPFPICSRHAARVYAFIRDALTGTAAPAKIRKQTAADLVPDEVHRQGVVYCVHVGDDIKIGWTSDLRRRLHKYPPSSTLLAFEPGSKGLEKLRHDQFVHLLVGGREWFHSTPEIHDHVAGLLRLHGAPGVDIVSGFVQRCA